MVVLCVNPECGAVLRVGGRPSRTDAIIQSDSQGPYFECPRCAARTRLAQPPFDDSALLRSDQSRL